MIILTIGLIPFALIGIYGLWWFFRQKKNYLIIKKDKGISDTIEYLQCLPQYSTDQKLIKAILHSTHYIQKARENHQPILILGSVMGAVESGFRECSCGSKHQIYAFKEVCFEVNNN